MSIRGINAIFAYNSGLSHIRFSGLRFALVIFKYFPYGGVQRDMLRMAKELVARGHVVDVLTMKWQGDKVAGVQVNCLPSPGWLNHQKYLNFAQALEVHLDSNSYDLVIGFNKVPRLDVYFAADPCYEARAKKDRHYLYRFLGRYRCFAAFERAVFSTLSLTKILLLTPKAKEDFQRYYGTQDDRFIVIPPYLSRHRMQQYERSIARQTLRKEFGLALDDSVVLMVGSGYQRKGLDRAIESIAALPLQKRGRVHLVMVGDGEAKPFRALSEKLGIAHQVHILSGRNDVPMMMQGADVFLHPARYEMAGNVIIEAMSVGLPVLVTEHCGYAYHVRQANAGVLIASPFIQEELNRELQKLLFSEQLEAYAANGIQYTKAFLRDGEAELEANIFERLAQSKSAAEPPFVWA